MQLSLVYDAAHVGATDWDAELGWFRRAVDILGHKEVAYRLDVQPSNLTDALHERERKDVKGRWISVVRRMVPELVLIDGLRLVNSLHGFEAPRRSKPLSPEDELRVTRETLLRIAPVVLQAVDREVGR